jgi:hypothetical protein
MRNSTSWHGLNADRKLSRTGRAMWLVANWLNNRFPLRRLDPELILTRFVLEDAEITTHWPKIDPTVSPARRQSDLFWYAYPWETVIESLGGEIRAVEVGCGTGKYGIILEECLGDALIQYTGVDLVEHTEWKELSTNSRFKFVVGDSRFVSNHAKGANLIVTQSALEHFDEDLTFMEQIAQQVEIAPRPVIQIHLMPSAVCLWTFLWHGARQYTPRTISKLTSLFDARTKKTLYALGSKHCNSIHRKYITWPKLMGKGDLRESRLAVYESEVRRAVEADRRSSTGNACFYACVLQSGLPQ